MATYDVGVIGSGPAGLAAAFAAKAQGLSVVIIEDYLWGGTCPNYGCDPKKILLTAVESIERQHLLTGRGLRGSLTIDWPALMAHKQAYVDAVEPRKTRGLDEAGIDRAFGRGQFVDAHTVELAPTGERLTAKDWVIAVGQRPRTLAFDGVELAIDSEAFLNLAAMPTDVTFVGAGFVGMEFATIAQAVGAKIRVVTRGTQALREFDQVLVSQVVDHLRDFGATFYFENEVVAVVREGDGFIVTLADGTTFKTELVVATAGRVGNADRLNLDAIGVAYNESGVLVDDYLRTNVANIYAIGDVAESPVPKIVPVGNHEGRYVANLIAGQTTQPIAYQTTPVVAFTAQRVAQTGVKMADAEELGYTVVDFDMSQVMPFYRLQDKARVRAALDGDGVFVGASVVAHEAEEVINYFVTAINERRTLVEAQANLYAYPSLGSEFSGFYG